MKTTARVRANRRNARRSTGPRSRAGKKRVARNALRHGLAVPIASLPEANTAVTRLVRLLAGADADAIRIEMARGVAEAQVDLGRVRKARMALFQTPLEARNRHTTKENMTSLRLAEKVLNGDADPIAVEQLKRMQDTPAPRQLDKYAHLTTVITDRSKELRRLDRYERRALSLRKFAIRELDSGQSRSR
jgi:hypothetical protein